MNDLQKLIKLRGRTAFELADIIGFGYHATQKVVKGIRHTEQIQTVVAHFLGLTREQAFGPEASKNLRPLIEAEIVRKQQLLGSTLKSKYLPLRKNRIADRQKVSNG